MLKNILMKTIAEAKNQFLKLPDYFFPEYCEMIRAKAELDAAKKKYQAAKAKWLKIKRRRET